MFYTYAELEFGTSHCSGLITPIQFFQSQNKFISLNTLLVLGVERKPEHLKETHTHEGTQCFCTILFLDISILLYKPAKKHTTH